MSEEQTTEKVKKFQRRTSRRSTAAEAARHNKLIEETSGGMTNNLFTMRDQVFRACCKRAGVHPSKRQASKFRRCEGAAYAQLKNITPLDMKH